MHYEIVTGECHEAVGFVVWVKLVSSIAIVDVIHLCVVLAKEGMRLLTKLAMTGCFSAEVQRNAWVVSFLNIVVIGNSVGKG